MDSHMVDTQVPASWRLLEYLSVHDGVSSGDEDHVDSLLADTDWDQLLAGALRQKLAPRLTDFLVRSERMSLAPKELRRQLLQWLHSNRHITALATAEADRIAKAVTERGVTIACTKGVISQATHYNGFGGRAFDDIDFMIHGEDKDRVADVLLDLGYLADMDHDMVADAPVARTRRDLAMYRIYPDHLPHFLRPLSACAIPYHVVDVCFNITWYGSTWQIPMADVLAERQQVDVVAADTVHTLPGLTAPYDFIFTVMHLFREGWFERIATAKSLKVRLFADVWRQWHTMDSATASTLSALIGEHAVAPPVAWVCRHVDSIFGSAIVAGLGLEDYCGDDWLHSAGATDGSYLSWTGSMRDRIRRATPPRFTPAPEPGFATAAPTRTAPR